MKSKFYYPGIWKYIVVITLTSQEIHGVSNLGNLNCLLNNFVGLAIEESSEPRIIGPIRGNHRPHNARVTQKHFPCHDVMVFISNVNFKPDWSLLCTSVSLSARIIDPPPPITRNATQPTPFVVIYSHIVALWWLYYLECVSTMLLHWCSG